MDIEEQLRQYAQQLRNSGASREQASAALAARRRELEESQLARPEQPAARAPEASGEGLTASQRARLAAQGALLSFGEEAEGAMQAIGALVPGGRSPREAYSETVERAREDIKKAYQERPLESLATEVGGGIIPSILAAPFTGGGSLAALGGRAAAAAPSAARAVRGARSAAQWAAARPIRGGAAVGAISGLGAGEDNLESRLASGAVGSVLGGTLGGAFRAAGAIGRRGIEFARNRRLMQEAQERSVGARAAGIPMSVDEAFAEIVAERRPEVPTREAVERIGEALLEQGIEPSTVGQRARPGQMVMELGTPVSELEAMQAGVIPSSVGAGPVQRLARGIAVAGGEPAERLRGRLAGRLKNTSERVKGEITARTLGERSPYLSAVDDLTGIRKQNADQLYGVAYEKTIPIRSLSRFANRPAERNWFVGTYRNAQRLSDMEVDAGIEGARRLPEIFEDVTLPSGDVVTRISPNVEIPVRAADYIQRAMRDQIDSGFRTGSIGQQQARVLKVDLENFLQTVDNLVPEFREARTIYRGDSANLEALNAAYNGGEVMLGKTPLKMKRFMQEKPEVVRRFLESQEVSNSEKVAYISAALESMLESVEGLATGRDPTRVLLGNEAMSQKVRLLLGSEEALGDFVNAMLPERGLKTLESQVFRQSATAEKLQDVAPERAGEVATSVLTGAPALAARIFVGDLIDNVVGKFTRAARSKAQRSTEARLLTMEPRDFEKFYQETYLPMVNRQQGLGSFGLDALRQAIIGQSARFLGREF